MVIDIATALAIIKIALELGNNIIELVQNDGELPENFNIDDYQIEPILDVLERIKQERAGG